MTVETFAAWKIKFDMEMQGTKKISLKDEATAKLTGTVSTMQVAVTSERNYLHLV